MNRRVLFIIAVLVVALGSGCSQNELNLHEPIDLVGTTQGVGSILFECAGPGEDEHSVVVGHLITIDETKPIFVDNNSSQRVVVSVGRHRIRIVSVTKQGMLTDGPRPSQKDLNQVQEFGQPVSTVVDMIDAGAAVVKYTPPLNGNTAGVIIVM